MSCHLLLILAFLTGGSLAAVKRGEANTSQPSAFGQTRTHDYLGFDHLDQIDLDSNVPRNRFLVARSLAFAQLRSCSRLFS